MQLFVTDLWTDYKDDSDRCWLPIKYRVITFAQFHPKILNYLIELTKRRSRTLFQSIQGIFQMTNFSILPLNKKTRWSLHIHFFLKISRSPWRNTFLIFNWCKGQFSEATIEMKKWTNVSLATGKNVWYAQTYFSNKK